MINGKTLLELGYKQGKWFKAVLEYANEHGLEGAALVAYLDSIRPAIVEPLETAVPFHVNIQADAVEEQTNVLNVLKTMEALMRTPTLVNGAVMPDACPTGSIGQIPVGGIAVARNAIHPAMHSADICCSVMMTNLGRVDPKKVLDMAHSKTHFGGGGRSDPFPMSKALESRLRDHPLFNNEQALQLARQHMGTQGDGNHFLYLGRSEQSDETIMVTHHGSRGLGAYLYKVGMKMAEHFRKEISPKTMAMNAWIPYDTDEGKMYWEALQIVRQWTKENHTALHNVTSSGVKAEPIQRFWNEHNFVFKEDDLFYHAKGATPLDDKFVPDSSDGLRLIPLNMKEPVLIVKGETTATNLGFAPHGAGRDVSRTQHKRNMEGRTKEEIFAHETKGLDVRFYSNHIDISELPSAYKNAQQIQDQMETFGLGQVVDKILPYGCIMAGDWEQDAPWRKRKAMKSKSRK